MTVLDQASQVVELDTWNEVRLPAYECRVWICPEPEGGYTAVVPSLPGVVTQGETMSETIASVKEAFQGVVAEYAANKEEIPWIHDIQRQKPNNVIEKWILVNV